VAQDEAETLQKHVGGNEDEFEETAHASIVA